MLATLVNSAGICVGSLIGLLIKKGLSDSLQNAIMKVMGLCMILIAMTSAIETNDTLCVVVSLVLGTLIGEGLRIDDAIIRGGDKLKEKISKKKDDNRFTEGFASASILFCVGSMAILGSIEAGINHDYSIIFAKTVMDFVTSIVFATTMGIGVMFSMFPVLIYQGLLKLGASALSNVMSDAMVNELAAVGGIILLGMAINMLGLSKKPIKVANMLPSIILAPIYVALFA